MTNIHETAYPILPAEPSAAELKASFTPTTAEMRFVRRQSRQESTAVLIMVQLKLLQRLGYFPMLSDVPHIIIDHLRAAFRIRSLPRTRISRYDRSGTRARHQKLLRAYVDIRQLDAGAAQWLTMLASESAQTKVELPDIVNVLIEELIRRRYDSADVAFAGAVGELSVNGSSLGTGPQDLESYSAVSAVSVSPTTNTTYVYAGSVGSCLYVGLPTPSPPVYGGDDDDDDDDDSTPHYRNPTSTPSAPTPNFTSGDAPSSCTLYQQPLDPVSVTYALPQITSISQSSPVLIGSGGSFTVNGSNLSDASNISTPEWNGNNWGSVPTPGSSTESVTFSIPSTATMGNYNFTISNEWGTSNSKTFTVGAPAAHVTSLSPPTWTAGTTFPLIITGTGFGSQPTVTISAPGVTPTTPTTTTSNGMSITLPAVSVAMNTPNEFANVTVQPGYTGSSYICGNCNGGSPNGTDAATVQAVAPSPTINLLNGTTSTPIVGQQISLSVTAPTGLTITTQSWSFSRSADVVAGYNASTASGSVLPVSSTSTTQSTLNFYYIASQSETVTVAVTYDNGEPANATVAFNVQGPSNPNITNTLNSVNVWPAGVAVGGTATGPYLEFGNGGNSAGVTFTGSATLPTDNQGAFTWVQLITAYNASYCVGGCPPSSSLGSGLDSGYPYPFANEANAVDSPGIELVGSNSEEAASFQATMYLMWTPLAATQCNGTSNNPCAIPIPLGSITWGFSGDAINTLSTNAGVSGTTWVLNSCSKGTAGTFVGSTGSSGYPHWLTMFKNQ
jgi:Domain of unknown function (DUF4158)